MRALIFRKTGERKAGRREAASHATSAFLDVIISAIVQFTIVGRNGGFADRIRVQWTWARPLPSGIDPVVASPLFCGGVTVFAPLELHDIPPTARVGAIGIGGLGHMALQFANKWGCEVHAFTTSDSKEQEARSFGAHQVHNTKQDLGLKSLAGSRDLIISTINVPQDIPALLATLAPQGYSACSQRCSGTDAGSGLWADSAGEVSLRIADWKSDRIGPDAHLQCSPRCRTDDREISYVPG